MLDKCSLSLSIDLLTFSKNSLKATRVSSYIGAEMRLTPPRRASFRILPFVTPWMLSLSTFLSDRVSSVRHKSGLDPDLPMSFGGLALSKAFPTES